MLLDFNGCFWFHKIKFPGRKELCFKDYFLIEFQFSKLKRFLVKKLYFGISLSYLLLLSFETTFWDLLLAHYRDWNLIWPIIMFCVYNHLHDFILKQASVFDLSLVHLWVYKLSFLYIIEGLFLHIVITFRLGFESGVFTELAFTKVFAISSILKRKRFLDRFVSNAWMGFQAKFSQL